MKKAPRKYAVGGSIDDPSKKKKIAPFTPNTSYATADEQFVEKGYMNPTTAKQRASQAVTSTLADDNTAKYVPPISQAGQGVGGGRKRTTIDANTIMITEPDGSTSYVDAMGNPKPVLGKAKGGTVRKMTKAPCKMNKGGTC